MGSSPGFVTCVRGLSPCGVGGVACRMQGSKVQEGMRGVGCRMWGAGGRMWGAGGRKMQGLVCIVQGAVCKVQSVG